MGLDAAGNKTYFQHQLFITLGDFAVILMGKKK
jgi:hypothetical protein